MVYLSLKSNVIDLCWPRLSYCLIYCTIFQERWLKLRVAFAREKDIVISQKEGGGGSPISALLPPPFASFFE